MKLTHLFPAALFALLAVQGAQAQKPPATEAPSPAPKEEPMARPEPEFKPNRDEKPNPEDGPPQRFKRPIGGELHTFPGPIGHEPIDAVVNSLGLSDDQKDSVEKISADDRKAFEDAETKVQIAEQVFRTALLSNPASPDIQAKSDDLATAVKAREILKNQHEAKLYALLSESERVQLYQRLAEPRWNPFPRPELRLELPPHKLSSSSQSDHQPGNRAPGEQGHGGPGQI
jgi:hypothetical protein